MNKRVIIGLTAAVLAGMATVGAAAPAQALPPGDRSCVPRHWTHINGYWHGRATDNSGAGVYVMTSHPSELDPTGVTNADGSVNSFCG
jgi:hypothetical protein